MFEKKKERKKSNVFIGIFIACHLILAAVRSGGNDGNMQQLFMVFGGKFLYCLDDW